MKAVILQSNYIPWKGYFDMIAAVDEFILFDDMQYTRRDWRNRNKIKTPNGLQWLTIPVEVKGKYFQKINETNISDKNWNLNHWKMIVQNYSRAKSFKEVKDFLENLYVTAVMENLSEINFHFLAGISSFLGIRNHLSFSSEFNLVEGKTERLLDICRQVNAADYYTGPAAKEYIDEDLFSVQNIRVHYFDYTGYQEYEQLFPPFEHGVSIIDLICNEGK